MKNEVKKIYDKSAFRENGYLIEKQKKVWLLSLSLRFSRFFAKLPGLLSDIAERFKLRATRPSSTKDGHFWLKMAIYPA